MTAIVAFAGYNSTKDFSVSFFFSPFLSFVSRVTIRFFSVDIRAFFSLVSTHTLPTYAGHIFLLRHQRTLVKFKRTSELSWYINTSWLIFLREKEMHDYYVSLITRSLSEMMVLLQGYICSGLFSITFFLSIFFFFTSPSSNLFQF